MSVNSCQIENTLISNHYFWAIVSRKSQGECFTLMQSFTYIIGFRAVGIRPYVSSLDAGQFDVRSKY
ncbi:hypothetical protein FRX31_013463 [Thalictrum thalictroides]|uniref:Uncharacterized protein n=1 Tax=Thalictrum thalictroides TaxID=46969 RepID=A0A7J6WHU4_THATH|nr:hypothetical protein FRX31_013463 [Thalictrum thalictroides]